MHLIVWEFRVKPGQEGTFEAMYGPGGEWASLFRTDVGWLGTELLRDFADPQRYLTIDRWQDATAYDRFVAAAGKDYQEIDNAGEGLTVNERLIGRFEIQGSRE